MTGVQNLKTCGVQGLDFIVQYQVKGMIVVTVEQDSLKRLDLCSSEVTDVRVCRELLHCHFCISVISWFKRQMSKVEIGKLYG